MQRPQRSKLAQFIAIAFSGLSGMTAIAAPNVQGGGSSLVAPTIGTIGDSTTEIGLFGTAEGSLTYYLVASTIDPYAFLNNQPTFFGARVTGSVHFANGETPLSTAQLTSCKAGLGVTNGPLIQIPYIVAPVTIPVVNGPAVTSTTTTQATPGQAHSIALNDDDLCGVFSGKLTNWNQVTNPETGSTYTPNAPITVIYRSDSNGTTELLTRHLATVCTTANTAMGVTFTDSLRFTASFLGGPVPANFIAASENGGVRYALSTSTYAALIAYPSPDYTNTFLAPSSRS